MSSISSIKNTNNNKELSISTANKNKANKIVDSKDKSKASPVHKETAPKAKTSVSEVKSNKHKATNVDSIFSSSKHSSPSIANGASLGTAATSHSAIASLGTSNKKTVNTSVKSLTNNLANKPAPVAPASKAQNAFANHAALVVNPGNQFTSTGTKTTTTTQTNSNTSVKPNSTPVPTPPNANVSNSSKYNQEIDGLIGGFQQDKYTGDCWLLAGVRALANTQNGAKDIRDSISKDAKGNVTVKLKGVNESYTFAPGQLIGGHSFGDADVRAIELAVEKHRLKLMQSGIKNNGSEDLTHVSEDAPLDSGAIDEAGYLLTGKKPLSTFDRNDMDNYLNSIKNAPGQYSGEVNFKNNHVISGDYVMPGIITNHAYTVKSVSPDGKTIKLTDPRDSASYITVSRQEFLEYCDEFALYDEGTPA